MITVKGRDLIIPVNERQIGTTYDNNAETRRIRMERAPGGIDLAHLTYRLDLEYKKNIKDTCNLEKELQDDGIVLVWTVPASCVKEAGTVWIAIRGLDGNGDIKWASNKGALYVYDTVNTPGTYSGNLTELEQLEADISGKMERIESGEEERKANEKIREQQEKVRQEASAEAVSAAQGAAQNAQAAAGKAESAVGETRSAIEDAGNAADAARKAAASVGEYRDQAREYAEAAERSNEAAAGHEVSAEESAQQAGRQAEAAAESAGAAEASAGNAADYAKLAQRYAEGHEEYPGSEEDNSEYYCRQAQQAKEAAEKARDEAENIIGIDIMTPEKAGIGKPDNVTLKVTEDGTLSVPKATGEAAGIVRPDGETLDVNEDGLLSLTADAEKLPAKDTHSLLAPGVEGITTQMLLDAIADRIVNKLVTDEALTSKLLKYISVDKIVNDLLSTDSSTVLAGPMGKELNSKLTELGENYTKLNSEISTLNSAMADYRVFKMRNNLTAEDNLNNITEIGLYLAASNSLANTSNNYPSGTQAGYLEVLNTRISDWILQRYTTYASGAIYTRAFYDSEWKPWKRITATVI